MALHYYTHNLQKQQQQFISFQTISEQFKYNSFKACIGDACSLQHNLLWQNAGFCRTDTEYS
jgi:hypothetical protein